MKIKIIKEKKGQYFAQLSGEIGIHAIGKTPEKAIEYLLDVIKTINEIKYENAKKTLSFDLNKPLFNFNFKSLIVNI